MRFPALLLVTLSLLSASGVFAQCSEESGTGCPGEGAVNCSGPVRIGTTLTLSCPWGPTVSSLLVIGSCVNPPRPTATGCGGAMCPIGVFFDLLLPGSIDIPIPNDPSIVGAEFCAQCARILPQAPPCITVSKAVRIVILN